MFEEDEDAHSDTLALCMEWQKALEEDNLIPRASADRAPDSPRARVTSPSPPRPRPSEHQRPSAADIQQALQLRQAELEAEIEPDEEAGVRVQVSPTSWLRIPPRAAREHADLSKLVGEARENAQAKATDVVERHRANVITHHKYNRGRTSLVFLLYNAELQWKEPTSSLAQEALRSLLCSQFAEVVVDMLEDLLKKGTAGDVVCRGAIRLLVLIAVPQGGSGGLNNPDMTSRAHRALCASSLSLQESAVLVSELLVRLHLDTGHAHYVLLLQELTEETSIDPQVAAHFLRALEQTHQTYADECHDGSADNYLDYHDLQVSLCSASLAYITGVVDHSPMI